MDSTVGAPPAQSRVRVALIGAGAWARACHLPVLASRGTEVELVAVSDVDAGRAISAARDFGFAYSYPDWRDVFAHPLDACIVSSPAAAHHAQALAALEAGAHVLVEKPMTLRSDHARELVESAGNRGLALLVGFGWNYSLQFAEAKRLFRDVGIGALEHVSVHMASGTRDLLSGTSLSSSGTDTDFAVSSTWTDPAISGGGYGHAQLAHAFGVLFGIVDDDFIQSTASGWIPTGARVETDLAISGRLESGATIAVSGASFHAGIRDNRHQLEIRLFGSEGNMLIDFGRDVVQVWRADGRTEAADLPAGAGIYDGSGPANALIDVGRGNRAANKSDGSIGLRTVRALEAAYTSMLTGATGYPGAASARTQAIGTADGS